MPSNAKKEMAREKSGYVGTVKESYEVKQEMIKSGGRPYNEGQSPVAAIKKSTDALAQVIR